MKEVNVDLFEMIDLKVDCIVITTNGMLRKDGSGVCGKGIAKQAKDRWDDFESILGAHLKNNDNTVGVLMKEDATYVCSFPTKNHWKENSSIELIEQSCKDLVDIANERGWTRIALPRLGCGCGNLDWNNVKPVLDKHFDDRFIVCHKNNVS